jgi:hypothetical protein
MPETGRLASRPQAPVIWDTVGAKFTDGARGRGRRDDLLAAACQSTLCACSPCRQRSSTPAALPMTSATTHGGNRLSETKGRFPPEAHKEPCMPKLDHNLQAVAETRRYLASSTGLVE